MTSWNKLLESKIPEKIAREIDVFETQVDLMHQGKIEEKLFTEVRLRRGVYGQRYDNGQRHNGIQQVDLAYPEKNTKGLGTLWHAPGMQRIKIPYGSMSAKQMEMLADLAEEYSDGICHVTTRQDIQLHYVHIEDTPDMMRRLASVGITTREACGNSVRNVTACPLAGVCRDELFDVAPYAKACADFLLGHPDVQDFGRKFKIAFSGCAEHACALVNMHDLGFIAKIQEKQDKKIRGFQVYVGGGLGAVPYNAKLLYDFLTEDELLPVSQAICRTFAQHGEKRNRAKARVKFLVDKMGIEDFRCRVEEERSVLLDDPQWIDYLENIPEVFEGSKQEIEDRIHANVLHSVPDDFTTWKQRNCYAQRQAGYFVIYVMLPLGDLTSRQMRSLADLARLYGNGTMRTTVDQNIVFRWIPEADLLLLYNALQEIGLGNIGANTIVDVTSCPGTDTCKLGIASSRGLAATLRTQIAQKSYIADETIGGLHIKVSGCFNSCGQHHLADLGFYGVSRKVSGTTVPHFRVVLGGAWERNASSYGQAYGAVPSKHIPQFLDSLLNHYISHRDNGEHFRDYLKRVGKQTIRGLIDQHADVPNYQDDPTCYSDWGDPREFTVSDIGIGECAGEVVSRVDFDLQEAEREYFEAQTLYDQKEYARADAMAYRSMLTAARGLIRIDLPDIKDEAETIVAQFRARFIDNGKFADKYAGNRFAQFLFLRHQEGLRKNEEQVWRLLEEVQLFIEAAYTCYNRIQEQATENPK